MLTFEQKLNNYAELAVKIGANVQPGQTLVVSADIDARELVRLIVKKAYEAGANFVRVNYTDEAVTRLRYDLAPDESFLLPPAAQAREWVELAEQNAAFLTVISANPDLLKGVDPERIANNQRTFGQAMAKYRQYQQADKMSWTGIAFPSPDWAAKVFPDLPGDEAVAKLWDAIFHAVRADQEDPVAAWQKHIDTLQTKSDELNGKKYHKLHFVATGTDLTIELPEGHIWAQAAAKTNKGLRSSRTFRPKKYSRLR
ncbi:Aminopeptidase 2 [Paenibacillus sp. P1XP2]|nr:Aminopeptidase 2 [Paenibacillus sp. P1XP2]